HGFGVEILGMRDVPEIYIASDNLATGQGLTKRDPQVYGTRHRSMMRFCAAHPGSIGFVVSQDGFVRAMTVFNGKLVMWENIQLEIISSYVPRRKLRVDATGVLRDTASD